MSIGPQNRITDEVAEQLKAATELLEAVVRDRSLLAALSEEERTEDPKRHEVLLAARNRDWIPKLKPHLERGGAFVAVGAAHFPGNDGLIELLRGEGYILSRVVRP